MTLISRRVVAVGTHVTQHRIPQPPLHQLAVHDLSDDVWVYPLDAAAPLGALARRPRQHRTSIADARDNGATTSAYRADDTVVDRDPLVLPDLVIEMETD